MNLVKLPKGVEVFVNGKRWTGKIPADVCPKKYADKPKAKPAKAD